MVPVAYLDAVRGVLDHLQASQLDAVDRAAELIVAALTGGGAVFCAEIGHSNQHDFLNRAGGLAALHAFTFSLTISDEVAACRRNRPRPEPVDRELEAVRCAVRTGNLRAGDVVLVGSVSGRSARPVELALACRALGVKVIAFTSAAYTARVTSAHPSGHRLIEVADVAVDIGAPYGDAAVTVPGIEVAVLPVSGAASIVAGWMVFGRVMERMAAAGDPPSVFMSLNRPEGRAWYDASEARFQERGY